MIKKIKKVNKYFVEVLHIHPIFLLIGAYMVLTKKGNVFLSYVLAVMLHEWAHTKVANMKGYDISSFALMPYGGVITAGSNIRANAMFYICLAGPLFNFCICILTVALWWIFPDIYSYTHMFFKSNLFIGIFNLMPIFPLDGGMAVVSVSKNKKRTTYLMKFIGILASMALFVFGLILIVVAGNFSFSIMGITLFLSAVSDENKDEVFSLAQRLPQLRNYKEPIKIVRIAVGEDLPISKIIKYLSRDKMIEVEIYSKEGIFVEKIEEKIILDIVTTLPINYSVKDALQCLKKSENSKLEKAVKI